MRLKDKVAIVTGGSMGNGKGIVDRFLEEGAKVYIFDIAEPKDSKYDFFSVDIRDRKAVEEAVQKIIKKEKHIDILVNNAGVSKVVPFLEIDDEMRDFHIDININGPWNTTKYVVPHMLEREEGSIINLSSVTGRHVADPGEVAYATSKAALIGFTKSLAMEFASKNIRVNAILPGYILTPMVEKMAEDTDKDNPQKVIDGIAQNVPMKRLGTPEEIGDLAVFLASDESKYITGSEFLIDGGALLPETMSMGQ